MNTQSSPGPVAAPGASSPVELSATTGFGELQPLAELARVTDLQWHLFREYELLRGAR